MANLEANGVGTDLEGTLWAAADKLRGTVDAAEYKHVVLGLLFPAPPSRNDEHDRLIDKGIWDGRCVRPTNVWQRSATCARC